MLLAVSCGGDETASGGSNAPPWGLDEIDMPDTEGDIAAVFASFPDEIDGRTRFGGGTSVIYETEDEFQMVWSIAATPSEELQTPEPGTETPIDYVVDSALRSGGASVEASAVEPTGELVWVAFNAVFQDAPVEGSIYMLAWAKPEGSWAFSLQADSEAGRQQLVQAFVDAANGPMSWLVNALVIAIVLAFGWWMFRYARSVYRGNYRHPKDVKQTWWVAGAGGHGGGGQVPPLIPDPDPEDEIR
jgi:hypothetical protein